MIKEKKSRIINISSDAGTIRLPCRSAYYGSKGGVHLLTKNLAIEWAKHNINVNAISPSFAEPPLNRTDVHRVHGLGKEKYSFGARRNPKLSCLCCCFSGF